MNQMWQVNSCSHCGSKKSRNRVTLPCSHTICKKHFKSAKSECTICPSKTQNLVQKEEPIVNKTQLISDIHARFQAIREQITLQKLQLNSQIETIYSQMIEQANKYEESYVKSIDVDEAMFSQLELRQISNHLKSNRFIPAGVSQSFGLLELCDFRNYQFESEILIGDQPQALIKLCGFGHEDQWSLLYRATRDGFHSNNFHAKCDGYSNTLTIIKAPENKDTMGRFSLTVNEKTSEPQFFTFGGYASVAWDSTSGWKRDESAFMFSLTNKENQPCKMGLDHHYVEFALYCHVWWWS